MRQRRKIGDILQVDLGDGTHVYARVLDYASFAFYDCRSNDDVKIEQIVKRPILFVIAVMNWAVTRGRWKRIGCLPLEDHLLRLPPKFIKDKISKGKYSLYFEDGKIRPAAREEC